MNIRDIAKICGVSTATVSKVLHNEGSISSETREKVLSVVKEYNYVPYSAVLKGSVPRMNVISVMLSDTGFEQELLYHIEREAFKKSYSVILCNISSENEQKKYYQILENKGVNGLITLCPARENQDGMPIVSILAEEQSDENEMNAMIRYDTALMGYMAVKYLFEAKHKNIACFLNSGAKEIEEGYINAYEEIFTKPKPEWIFHWDKEKLDEMISVCIADEITAVVCSDVELCSLICDRLRFHGIRVPAQISIICIGNRGIAEYLSPQITTVELPVHQMAVHAVSALVGMMERQETGRRYHMDVEPLVIERGSVVPYAGQKSGKIVVIGCMNADYYFISNDMIKRDSTIRIKNTMFFPGGEGANQAAGIGKLGGYASMIGCLGNDQDGKMILNGLTDAGVEVEGVQITNSAATGKAYIVLDADGKEEVIIQEGANGSLSGEYVRNCSSIFENAKLCLLSMEIPSDAILETADYCCSKGIKLIVKGPSTDRIEEKIISKIDYLVANEEEAKRIIPGDMSVEERAEALFNKGIKNVIITPEYHKSYLKNEQYSGFFETEQFPAVDALGVTDAFISALAVELSRDEDIVQAMELATYAAGVSITRVGVQQSMIDREGLERYKEHIS